MRKRQNYLTSEFNSRVYDLVRWFEKHGGHVDSIKIHRGDAGEPMIETNTWMPEGTFLKQAILDSK